MAKKKKNEVGFVKKGIIAVKDFMNMMKHGGDDNILDLNIINQNLDKIQP